MRFLDRFVCGLVWVELREESGGGGGGGWRERVVGRWNICQLRCSIKATYVFVRRAIMAILQSCRRNLFTIGLASRQDSEVHWVPGMAWWCLDIECQTWS